MTTATGQPRMMRTVIPAVVHGRTVHLAPLDSTTGRTHSYDVRLGVGFPADVAGFAATTEDDPVILVVVNAAVPCEHWETAAATLGRWHGDDPHPEMGLLADGATTWLSLLGMPERWITR
jgi:hypothetical protein